MKFRKLLQEDLPALGTLFDENNVPEITRHFHPFPLSCGSAREILKEDSMDHYFGIFCGAQLAGFSMLRGWDEGYDVPSFGMFVSVHSQNKGIGSKLLDLTLKEAGKMGCRKIRLSVYEDNDKAHHMYESRGFTQNSAAAVTVKEEIRHKIVMSKELGKGKEAS